MHTIILGMSAQGERIAKALSRVFRRTGGALIISEKGTIGPVGGYGALVVLTGEGAVIDSPGALMLLPADSPPPILRAPVTLVADSARQSWPSLPGGQLISCGFSPKDTFTLSSRTEDSAVVALMRRVRSVSGEIVDPCEVPVLFGEGDPFIPLGVISALLLTGNGELLEAVSHKTNNLQL